MGRTGTTRRYALMATGAGLLTACSSTDVTRKAARKAEDTLRLRSARTSRALLVQYDAVLARHPDRSAPLAPLRAAVAAHVRALEPTPPASAAPSPGATASRSPEPAATATRPEVSATAAGPPAVPADPAEAVRALVAAERRTADAHTRALLDAPPELARLLASLAAAGAAHVYLLTKGSAP